MQNIKTALAAAVEKLTHTSPSAELDGEVLLSFVLGKDRAWLYAHGDEELREDEINRFEAAVAQRAAGTPVAHLTGTKEFYGRPFHVTPDVLIPRPATEELVAVALQSIRTHVYDLIVDVGTGSGCIAVALACETSNVPIIATDISPKALAVASKNAALYDVTKRIQFIEGDLLSYTLLRGRMKVGDSILVVSNLPYLPSKTITDELLHEPRLALDGGLYGGELYRRLDQQLEELSRQRGVTVTLISERLAYSKNMSVPSFTISTQTFPGAKEISSPVSV